MVKEIDSIKERLHISGMDPKGDIVARENGLGFEVTRFSWALMFDDPQSIDIVKSQIEGIDRLWFHSPFAELYPSSIDPLAREVAVKRYTQSVEMAKKLGIKNIVIHGGFIPMIYFPEWFVDQSVSFWKEFLPKVPEDMVIALENVMDPTPDMLVKIVSQVDDKRLRLCLDIGHANAFVSKLPPIEWVEPMAPFLAHTHIHNNFGDKDIHAPLGEGTIDMVNVLNAIKKTKATFSIETQQSRTSVEWLKENGFL